MLRAMIDSEAVPTTPPRYSAPDRSRQRVRLIAAIGLLASTAIAIGGLVHLFSAEDEPAGVSTPGEKSDASQSAERSAEQVPRDSLRPLLTEVERAERAVSSARAALRRARILGGVDPEQLDWLERRLDALGSPTAPPRGHTDAQDEAPEASGSVSGEGPREL